MTEADGTSGNGFLKRFPVLILLNPEASSYLISSFFEVVIHNVPLGARLIEAIEKLRSWDVI